MYKSFLAFAEELVLVVSSEAMDATGCADAGGGGFSGPLHVHAWCDACDRSASQSCGESSHGSSRYFAREDGRCAKRDI